MAILKNCELYFIKCDPKRPNAKYDKKNPYWEVQLRTTNLAQKREWEAAHLKPKLIVGKEGADDEGEPVLLNGKKQWRVNLRKRSIKKDGEKASPVNVVNGTLEEIDPNTVGNGSVGHLRIFQYEYPSPKDGSKAIATVLMGIQIVKHVVYTPTRDDDFEMTETEVIEPAPTEDKDSGHTSDDSDHDDSSGDDDDDY